MMAIALPASPIPALRAVELDASYEPLLQRFFEANPEYFLTVNGEPAGPNEAHDEIRGEVPADMSFTRKWLVGYVDAEGSMVALANVIIDLLAPGVWHIGLFIVASSRHGTGEAHAIHHSLERWAAANGANWLRLGVVQGNARAERFWEALGYIQTRTREDVAMGRLTNTLRVMVKPLSSDTLEHYLSLVPRDQPEIQNVG